MRLERGEDGSLRGAAFHAQGKDGKLAPAGEPGPALPVHSFVVEGRFSGETRRVELDKLEAAIGGAEVASSASFSASDVVHGLELRGDLKSLPISELKRLWPRGAAVGAREWIAANIHEGSVPSGRFVIRLPAAGESAHPLPADAVDVKFDFAGLGLQYYGELDPIREARGSGTLSADSFEGRVSQAQVGGLELESGRVAIDWGGPVAKLAVQADVAGPSAAALALVDQAPLRIAQKIGVAPQDLGGNSKSHIEVSLPLKGELHTGDVHVAVDGSLSDASLAKLIGDVGFNGATLAVKVRDGTVDVEGDAAFTGLPVPVAPSRAKVSFEPAESGMEDRLQIDVAGTDLVVKATAILAAGVVTKLVVADLHIAGSEMAGVVTNEAGTYHASVQAKTFDLGTFIEAKKQERGLRKLPVTYQADFKVDRVLTKVGVEFADVAGHVSAEGDLVRAFHASGEVVDGGSVRIELRLRGGKQQLRVQVEQPAPLLKALGFEATYQGGRVTLVIDLVDGGLGPTLDGRVYMRDVKVSRAPLLAQILSVGSLNGIASMLNGKGLEFSLARIPFRWSYPTIELHDALAVGAIGLTAAGSIDRANRRMDLRGRVIPSYTLNSALGKVPFIGEYLVGGKDEGIFGIDYSAKGSLDSPDVSVNPLSALAPGALRKMFIDPFKSDPDSSAAAPEKDAGQPGS
jgi:hypothetical protein